MWVLGVLHQTRTANGNKVGDVATECLDAVFVLPVLRRHDNLGRSGKDRPMCLVLPRGDCDLLKHAQAEQLESLDAA